MDILYCFASDGTVLLALSFWNYSEVKKGVQDEEEKNLHSSPKSEILREHLENQLPVSELCERYQITPTNFYNWKKKLFEGALQIFSTVPTHTQKKIERLEQKLQDRDSLISAIVRENIQFKKT